jgi:O-succinylbenzoate-CoA ligase
MTSQHNIGLILKKRALISARSEAFVEIEKQRRFTFSELNTRSNQTANMLLAQGLKPGDRVATLLKNGIEFIESYFAIAKIGAVMVPVNWRLAPAEIAYILADAGASLLIYDAEFDPQIEALQSGTDKLDIAHWVRVGSDTRQSTQTKPASLDYDAASTAASAEEPPIGAYNDDLLFIMYTSGTTGRPKGAMQSHNTMLWAQLSSLTTSDMRGNDRFLLPLPMFHVGCLVPVSQLVHRGATGIIMREVDIDAMFRAIEAERVSIFMSVPALLQFMLYSAELKTRDISSVRWIVTGAAPVPVSLLHDYQKLGIAIYQAYGLTESCGPGTLLGPQDAEAKAGSAGHPQLHTEIKVVDMLGNEIQPGSDAVGELLIGGPHIMLGYWNNPQATADTIKDGWLYTGDLVTLDADGCITICDRKKDMIISGGENIYPAELENILTGSPEVQEVAVIGISSKKWGETPLAIIVPAAGEKPSAESLIAYCKQHLASYKVPQVYEFVESLPRNPSGKLLKPELRKQFSGPAPF